MNLAAVLVELARRDHGPPIPDPLPQAAARVAADSVTGEGRLFLRLCGAIATSAAEFRPEELALLGPEAAHLVRELAEARVDGRYPAAEWERFQRAAFPPSEG